jgi:hypothetical protein
MASQAAVRPSLPSELIEAFQEGRAAVFVGAGVSMAAGLPSWDELVIQLAEKLNNLTLPQPPLSPDFLLKIPQYYSNQKGRRELVRTLKRLFEEGIKKFGKSRPAIARPVHHHLVRLPTRLYYTTNLDTLLEDEFQDQHIEIQIIDNEAKAVQYTERGRCQVRKLHGSIEGEWEDIVITRSDYDQVSDNRAVMFQALSEDLKSHVFLFVGYSLRDPDFGSIYHNVRRVMKDKHQTHFLALGDDPGPYEIEDLHRRGLGAIELWKYPGQDKAEQLILFLDSLVDATSEQIHLQRFYRGLERGEEVPIIITSRLHEKEGYVFHPACDIHTANQVKEDIGKIGTSGYVLADEFALRNTGKFLSSNVILICSPFGNNFTKHVLAEMEKLGSTVWPRFEETGNLRSLCTKEGQKFIAGESVANQAGRQEYAVVARFQNPWASGKYIFVFAGAQAVGTHAIGEFLKQRHGYQSLNKGDRNDNLSVLISIIYTGNDAFNYEIAIQDLFHLQS